MQTALIWVVGEVDSPHWENEAYHTSQQQLATPAHLPSVAPQLPIFSKATSLSFDQGSERKAHPRESLQPTTRPHAASYWTSTCQSRTTHGLHPACPWPTGAPSPSTSSSRLVSFLLPSMV